MTAYAGGPQIQNYLDPNRPDYGDMVLSNAENASALEKALMQLNADVRGTELIEDARVKAAELGYQGAANLANAGTFAAGMGAIGDVAGSAIGAYGDLGGFGGDIWKNPTARDITIDHSTDTGSAVGKAYKNDGGLLYWDSDMDVNKSVLRR